MPRVIVVTAQETGRVLVGVDGSSPSLRALREAAALARQRHASLCIMHVRPRRRYGPPAMAAFYGPMPAGRWNPDPVEWLDAASIDLIKRCIDEALGGEPQGIDVRRLVLVGSPEFELAGVGWREDDILVVGAGGGLRWRHPLRRSVSRYCVKHSRCPVLVTPRTALGRAARHGLSLHRTVLPRDPWEEFDATARREARPIG